MSGSKALKLSQTYKEEDRIYNFAMSIANRAGSLQDLLDSMDKNGILDFVNLRNSHGYTLLHSAVFSDNENAVKKLLDCGASVQAEDNYNSKPLHYATSANVAKLLIDHNAEIDAKDGEGNTILYYAFVTNNARLASLLLQNKADFSAAKQYCHLPTDCTESKFLDMMMYEDYLELE